MLEIETKLNILNDALDKKAVILEQIYNITENEEMFFKTLKGNELNEYISQAIKEKQNLIDKLNNIDSAFISVFESFKGSLNLNRQKYRESIISIQEKIKDIIDIDVKIRIKEERNKAFYAQPINMAGKKINSLKTSKSYILEQYLKNNKK